MTELRKPKIGLAGVMCTPFRGDKESNYAQSRAALEQLALELDFDLQVIPDGIYTLEDAQKAVAILKDWGADFILLQTSSFAAGEFIYPFAESGRRLGLWSVPEGPPSAEGGLPLNSFTAANLYNSIIKTRVPDYPHPMKWLHGDPGQPLFDERLRVTVQALRALVNLPDSRIGLIGGVAPGFDNLIVDEAELKQKLGIEVQSFTLEDVLQRAEAVGEKEAEKVGAAIRSSSASFDESQSPALAKSARVNLALQQLAAEHNLQGLAVSCWPQFQEDFHFAVCTVMGQMNTDGLVAACEGDVASTASMLALRYMGNGDVVTLMDLVSLDTNDESVLLWHCGPTSPALADEKGVKMSSLWLFDGYEGEPIGLHNDLVLKPGPATVFGFSTNFEEALILSGEMDNRKESYMGSRGWMKKLHMNGQPISTASLAQSIMNSGFQHHYPFGYGELSSAGIELCAWLGVRPIQATPSTNHLLP